MIPKSKIPELIMALQSLHLEPTDEDIADILWLALQIGPTLSLTEKPPQILEETHPYPDLIGRSGQQHDASPTPPKSIPPAPTTKDITPSSTAPASGKLHPTSRPSATGKGTRTGAHPFKTPAATALPGTLALGRAIRPLRRKVASHTTYGLDEEETAQRIAEQGLWIPVLKPAQERWLDIALVIDESRSIAIWRQTIAEFQLLLERHGAFRDVRTWGLVTDEENKHVRLHLGFGLSALGQQTRDPSELVDPSGRRLILVISDCVKQAWYNGAIGEVLARWGSRNPVALLQVLPRALWTRTALGDAEDARLRATLPGQANMQLQFRLADSWVGEEETSRWLPLPTVTLDPDSLKEWTLALTGAENVWTHGYLFGTRAGGMHASENQNEGNQQNQEAPAFLTAEQRLKRFRDTASPTARKLAGLLAATPITLPVVRLIQQTMLPESQLSHVAEIFLGGILEQLSTQDEVDSNYIRYDFIEGVRDLLLDSLPTSESVQVIKNVSDFVEERVGQFRDFLALLSDPTSISTIEMAIDETNRSFATIKAKVLRRLGGQYVEVAKRLEEAVVTASTPTRTIGSAFTGDNSKEPSTDQTINRPIYALDPYMLNAFWYKDQISITFNVRNSTSTEPSESSSLLALPAIPDIIDDLEWHIQELNDLIKETGFGLSFDRDDNTTNRVRSSRLLQDSLATEQQGNDLPDIILFKTDIASTFNSETYSAVAVSNLYLKKIDGAQLEMTGSQYEVKAMLDTNGENQSILESPVPRIVNIINASFDPHGKQQRTDAATLTSEVRSEKGQKVSIAAASPSWLCMATPPVPPIPVLPDKVDQSSPGHWPIRLLGLPDNLLSMTGEGVTVFVLDTMPTISSIKRAAASAGNGNLLLNEIAIQMNRSTSPHINFTYQDLPDTLEKDDQDVLRAGKDIKGRLYGFRLQDHGVFITGVIRDLAPKANIEYIRVLNDFGVGDIRTLTKALDSIQARMLQINPYTHQKGDLYNKPVVINLSLVAFLSDDLALAFGFDDLAQIRVNLLAPIQCLVSLGAIFIASAGNEGDARYRPANPMNLRPEALYPAAFAYQGPAGLKGLGNSMIPVGAVEKHGNPTAYSCYPGNLGIATYGGDVPKYFKQDESGCFTEAENIDALIGIHTSLSYPALLLEDCRPTYPTPNAHAWAYWSGTSFATPIITGLVARMVQYGLENPGAAIPPGVSLQQALMNFGAARQITWDRLDPNNSNKSGRMIMAVQATSEEVEDEKVKINVKEVDRLGGRNTHLAKQPDSSSEDDSTSPQKTKEQWLDEGNTLANLKRYEDALVAYDQALRLDPNNATTHTNKGIALAELKRYQEALAACDQALRLDPNNATTYTTKGIALVDLERYQEALDACNQAHRLNPNDVMAYICKSAALIDLKRYEDALAACDQALTIDPNYADAYHNKGVAFERLGKKQESQQAYKRASELNHRL